MSDPKKSEPVLLNAASLVEADVGLFEWSRDHNSSLLSVSSNGRTVEWGSRKPEFQGKLYPPVWVPASTQMHLHSGTYQWDFVVDEMACTQIGVGFMLLWDVGPDWGFFGYLGASPTAWAYDPSTGDVVCNTDSIQGDLPKFANGRAGVVSVHLRLPRHDEGFGTFVVDDMETRRIRLPVGAVVLPAACLFKETQQVSLNRYERS
jgi:hypothetical protein